MSKIIGISGRKHHGKDTFAKVIQYVIHENYYAEPPYDNIPNIEDFILNGCETYTSHRNSTTYNIIKRPWDKQFHMLKFSGAIKQIASLITGKTLSELESHVLKDHRIHDSFTTYKHSKDGSIISEHTYEELIETQPEIALLYNKRELLYRDIMKIIGEDFGRNSIHPDIWAKLPFNGISSKLNYVFSDLRRINEAQEIINRNGVLIRIFDPQIPKDENPHITETELDSFPHHFTVKNDGDLIRLKEQAIHILKELQII